MAELKNIRIAVSGIYDYAKEELATLRLSLEDAPEWVVDAIARPLIFSSGGFILCKKKRR